MGKPHKPQLSESVSLDDEEMRRESAYCIRPIQIELRIKAIVVSKWRVVARSSESSLSLALLITGEEEQNSSKYKREDG